MGVSIEFQFIYGSLANVNITARRLIELIEYLISSTYCTRFGRVYIRDFKIRQMDVRQTDRSSKTKIAIRNAASTRRTQSLKTE